MNIRAYFTQVSDAAKRRAGEVRLAFHIAVDATREEAALFATTQFVNTATQCPVRLYQFANKAIITGATMRSMTLGSRSVPMPAFVKARMPIQSFVPGVMLRIPYPGDLMFGYINPADQAQLSAWLEREFAAISTNLVATANAAVAETAVTTTREVSRTAAVKRAAAPAPITVTHEVQKVGRVVMFAEDEAAEPAA